MSKIDPNLVTAQTAGGVFYSSRTRTATTTPPTPEQLSRRERDTWNRAVENKKAAKRRAKGRA